jgi:hypothetical protein
MNAGAILYGATREWFSILSARSLYGIAELPTIDARVFLAPTPVTAKKILLPEGTKNLQP